MITYVFNKSVSLCELERRAQRVLYNAHDRLVGRRCNDLTRHSHNLGNLSARLDALRQVQVHLVAVEIGVVRTRDTARRERRGWSEQVAVYGV